MTAHRLRRRRKCWQRWPCNACRRRSSWSASRPPNIPHWCARSRPGATPSGTTAGATATWRRSRPDQTSEEIDRGIEAVQTALHGVATNVPSPPFFRFPYFASTPATLDLLQSRRIVVFGADLWASDWRLMTPRRELKLVTDRLKTAGRGIILFHDPRAQTAAMLPAFLRYLRGNHYRVVHVVPAEPAAHLEDEPEQPKSSAELKH